MATIVLSAVGAAAGAAVGGNFLGLSSVVIGRAIGATVGNWIDQQLLGAGSEVVETGRVERFRLQGASEGSPVLQAYGRVRLAGQVIWSTEFLETVTTEESGGKGTSGTTTSTFSYSVSLAVGLCAGEITGIGRIWADGQEIARDGLTVRVYTGTEDQMPDPKIAAVQGEDDAPAYRGIAYVVFEDLDLTPFGNRVPQFNFEVLRPEQPGQGADPEIARGTLGVALMPGTGEYALATQPVYYDYGPGEAAAANLNSGSGKTDFLTALDQLTTELPNCGAVSLIVSWFGDDLRCGDCRLRPKVEQAEFEGTEMPWAVSGIGRGEAEVIAQADGRPVYGGTPTDRSVMQAIQEMRAAGQAVTFYPFILMEQMAGNTMPDPLTGGTGQPVLPWRGRITTSLAPGLAGSPDRTAVAEAEVEAFFGQAAPADFSATDQTVTYAGPEEWSYRRFILHYAHLCAAAGGVDAFCIGSEMRGLTQIRGTGDSFPAVEALRALLADVRAILGPGVKLGYAADWSEYFGYHPQDGSGDVYFHLDPLWAEADLDFIGVDNYLPLSDWRDGPDHADAHWGAIHDLDYLKDNVCGGEYHDWYYGAVEVPAVYSATEPSYPGYSGHLGDGSGLRDGALSGAASGWGSATAYGGEITADLGTAVALEAIRLAPFDGFGGWGALHLNGAMVEVSFDGLNWTAAGVVAGAVTGQVLTVPLDARARFVRLSKFDDWFGLAEFRPVRSAEDVRDAQIRLPISDAAHGKPWVFRPKDFHGWWSNVHHERVGGVEVAGPTAWVPQSKPIWFTEYGCAAIDKGTNQPNKFLDPKSSESRIPHYSTGTRDEYIQMQYLRAMSAHWSDPANNPVSSVYGAPMIDMGRAHVWAWDARPYPQFPANTELWSDGGNHALGHWITGRTASRSLAGVVEEVCATAGVTDIDTGDLHGLVRGYTVSETSTARSILQPLMLAYGFDALDHGGTLTFRTRSGHVDRVLDRETLALSDELDGPVETVRAAEAETAGRLRLVFVEADGEFETRAEEAVFADEVTHAVSQSDIPLVLSRGEGRAIVERWLAESRIARDRVRFALPPSGMRTRAGDVVSLETAQGRSDFRIDRIEAAGAQLIEAVRVDGTVFGAGTVDDVPPAAPRPVAQAAPVYPVFMDLPLLTGGEAPEAPHLAVAAVPWPGPVSVFRAPADAGYGLNTRIEAWSVVGITETDLPDAVPGLFDRGPELQVRLIAGQMASTTPAAMLEGANLAAIGDPDTGVWEVFQFETATLVAPRVYALSRRLRGQAGTDAVMPPVWPAGSHVILLNGAPRQIGLAPSERGLERHYRIGAGYLGYDHPSFRHLVKVFDGVGLRPYAPAHLRAARAAEGAVDMAWIRRSRIDGDSWSGLDVPLGEASEAYLVQVAAGGVVRRQTVVTAPAWRYEPAAQAADGLTGAFDFAVAQISDRFGPGPFAWRTFDG